MTINELRAKRNQAWEAAKAFVETKRNSDGLLSDEDAKTYAQMEKKVQDYGAEIERMEAMSAMDAQLSKPTSTPVTETPMNGKLRTARRQRPAVHPMPTRTDAQGTPHQLPQVSNILRRALMPMVATWFPKSMKPPH